LATVRAVWPANAAAGRQLDILGGAAGEVVEGRARRTCSAWKNSSKLRTVTALTSSRVPVG
jgi:hypothetical protein